MFQLKPDFEVINYGGKSYLLCGKTRLSKTVTQQIVVFCPNDADKVGNLYPIHKGDFIGVYTHTSNTVTLIGYHVDKVLAETVITSPTDTHLIIAKP